jgi:hypothetical protein
MAVFKVSKATAKGKAWKAEGTNPKTGRSMTIQGGEDKHRGKWGTSGGKSEGQVKSFKARHGEVASPKQYVNKVNWERGSRIGKSVNIPNRLFKK